MTLSFSGHRPEKIKDFTPDTERRIRAALHASLVEACRMGYRQFLSGMAPGFDLWAADEVLKLRETANNPDIELTAVVPYPRFRNSFAPDAAELYDRTIGYANRTVTIAPEYHHAVFHRRNDFLVDNASLLICYYEGTPGGTRYTVQRAARKGLRIVNLFAPELFVPEPIVKGNEDE